MKIFRHILEFPAGCPVGLAAIFETGGELIKIELDASRTADGEDIKFISDFALVDESTPLLVKAEKQLLEYFSGTRKKFSLPLKMHGSDFQIKAWTELLKIPYGSTVSYSRQAEKIGGKQYRRAVGGANSKNPLPIVVPCHRVIGSDGKLTGFRSGLAVKKWLLELEGGLKT